MMKFVLMLTLFRILAGPIIFFLIIVIDASLLALLMFLAASISDFLDGKLARSFNVESALGAILDPIADKILILFAFFSITLFTNDPFVAFLASVILARELWVSVLREYAAQNSISNLTKVTFLAKMKASVQFFSISMFFLGFAVNNALIVFLAKFMLFLAFLITLKTGIDYTIKVFVNKL